jgi:hypothetical protein
MKCYESASASGSVVTETPCKKILTVTTNPGPMSKKRRLEFSTAASSKKGKPATGTKTIRQCR